MVIPSQIHHKTRSKVHVEQKEWQIYDINTKHRVASTFYFFFFKKKSLIALVINKSKLLEMIIMLCIHSVICNNS